MVPAPKAKANLQPFRAIRYSQELDLDRVTCPPYDVISPAMRQSLELLHTENFVRITLPGEPADGETTSKYDKAADYLNAWLRAGVLFEETEESLFLYRNDFVRNGKPSSSGGVVGALRLETLGSSIHPHETTMPEPKADRLALMRATSANLEPLWFVGAKPSGSMRSIVEAYDTSDPAADVEDSQAVRHRLWRLSPKHSGAVRAWIEATDLVVADGHHRYETALTYARERREYDGPGGWDYTLALVADGQEFAPLLLPIHRLVRGLDAAGVVHDVPATRFSDTADQLAEVVSTLRQAVGLVTTSGSWLVPVEDELETGFVQDLVNQAGASVSYEHELGPALEAVQEDTCLFVMPPVDLQLVISEALAGRTMPPKSTLFWPKPVSGMVMRRLQ